jgi:hypothetical protein
MIAACRTAVITAIGDASPKAIRNCNATRPLTCQRNGNSFAVQGRPIIACTVCGPVCTCSWSDAVKKLISLSTVAGVAFSLAGCANPPTPAVQKEDLLADAGFQVRIADSPHRVKQMMRLPPNKFVTRVRGGQLVYLYADPYECKCVYLGYQKNWDAYRQELAAQQIADVSAMTASPTNANWDFNLWALPTQGGPP